MYLDTAIIVKLLVKEELSDFFEVSLKNLRVATSALSLLEVRSALYSKHREKIISETQRLSALQAFQEKIMCGEIKIFPLNEPVFTKAAEVMERCYLSSALRTLDAIQLAACDISQVFPLCATDSRMRAGAQKLGIPLFPETLPS
jgi:predicted nucleic acid-binding protein